MLLTKTQDGVSERAGAARPRLRRLAGATTPTMDRRAFLKRSGLVAGAGAFASQLPFNVVGKAEAAKEDAAQTVVKRTVCTHCSVGCAVDAVVQNGVWIRQEPVFDSPLNLGAHCAKGASVREHGMHEDSHRLKTPMKLVNGKWQKIPWDQAINEVGDRLLAIKKESGPDAVFWVGSSKHSNEQAYMMRKFVSFFGTNNMDHQARICHSTTVAGVANTWGYGAMTNSYNDMQNTRCAMYIGSNAAEAHPVSMLHMLHAKETGAKMIVVDPRFTRTAAKADVYVRIRSGTDIPFLFGILHHVFKNGWEDKQYIHDRVYGMDKVRDECLTKWTPDKVEEVTGIPEAQVYQVAEMMAKNRPSTVVWCMGQTQHTIGNAIVRASCIVQLALGNVGISGGGTNIFRGHDNVQGATDVGPNPDSLPGYYGLAAGSWKHFAAVWGVDYEWIKKQFASQAMMEKPGMTVSRWIDGVMEKNELIDQDSNLRAMVFWGHAPNSQTRGMEMQAALQVLDTLVIVDPYPSATAAMAAMPPDERAIAILNKANLKPNPNRAVYLLPACTQFETSGSVTASGRSVQWREKVIEPLFESKPDHTLMLAFAKKFGYADQLLGKQADGSQKIKTVKDKDGWDEPVPEDLLREINRGMWTIGYTGQSPERLKLHMKNMNTFDAKTMRAKGGPCDGDYFGLPWPCYGTPEIKHPGSQPLRPLAPRDGWRRLLPRQFRHRARRRQSAGRGWLVPQRLRAFDRLPGIRSRAAEEARLVGRPDRAGEKSRRRQELEDRSFRRHPAGRDEARLPSLRQCEGARHRLEFPGRHSAASRTVVFAAAGHGCEISDARRQEGVLAPAHALQGGAAGQRQERGRQELSAGADLGPPGRIRGRRRGNAIEQMAGGAAAGELRRDQPEGRQRSRREGRRICVGQVADRRADQGQGSGNRTCSSGHDLHPVSFLRLVDGQGHAPVLPRGVGADRAW
jgi:formate dehydrogenase major subunit